MQKIDLPRSTNLFFKIIDRGLKNTVLFFVRPILEEQALLREKLKTMPTWKKDKEPAVKRKTQPMVRDLQVASGHVSFSKVIGPIYYSLFFS